jgi:hypothetical protein
MICPACGATVTAIEAKVGAPYIARPCGCSVGMAVGDDGEPVLVRGCPLWCAYCGLGVPRCQV